MLPRHAPGLVRRGAGDCRSRDGDGFVYRDVDGKRVRSAELRRSAPAIPPAYEDV
jgi:DNA topoisomerase IB